MNRKLKRIITLLICTSLLFTFTVLAPFASSALATVTPGVSIGNNFTLALDAQGTIYAWGDSSSGVVPQNTSNPIKISVLNVTFQKISAGFDHALALSSDGKVYAWGNNENGQLGINNYNNQTAPTLVEGLQDKRIVAISAGNRFSLALSEDGKVYAFGWNNNSQLGIDGEPEYVTPTVISALSGVFVTKIEASYSSAVAIDADEKAYVWGKNDQCQLGTSSPNRLMPTVLSEAKTTQGILQAAVGEGFTAYLQKDGTVGFMGLNDCGQYGNGVTSGSAASKFKFTDTASLNAVALATAGKQTVLLGLDGTVYTAGRILGSDDTSEKNTSFVPFFDGTGSAPVASSIAAGYNNGALIAQDGSVWMWGDNSQGQLGNGGTTSSATPVRVCGAENATFTLGSTPHIQQVQLSFSTAIPAPDFAVTIPSTVQVEELHQTTASDPGRYSKTELIVEIDNVKNLYGEKKIVFTVESNAQDQSFYLEAPSGQRLPYSLSLTENGDPPLQSGDTFAEFTSDGSVSLWLLIDQSQILKSGIYTGTLTFFYQAVDVTNQSGGAT